MKRKILKSPVVQKRPIHRKLPTTEQHAPTWLREGTRDLSAFMMGKIPKSAERVRGGGKAVKTPGTAKVAVVEKPPEELCCPSWTHIPPTRVQHCPREQKAARKQDTSE